MDSSTLQYQTMTTGFVQPAYVDPNQPTTVVYAIPQAQYTTQQYYPPSYIQTALPVAVTSAAYPSSPPASIASSSSYVLPPRDPREQPPPPPPSPPKPKGRRLPPNWKTAKDKQGKMYFYHAITR